MNIYALSDDPKEAARFHNDRHVIKMVLVTAQLLSTAHIMLDGMATARARIDFSALGRSAEGHLHVVHPGNANHPCAKWARHNAANYRWLADLGVALAHEYAYRFDKAHILTMLLLKLRATLPLNLPHEGPRTPFPQHVTAQHRRSDPVEAYRRFYVYDKPHLAQWTKVGKPEWWDDIQKERRHG